MFTVAREIEHKGWTQANEKAGEDIGPSTGDSTNNMRTYTG